MLLYIDIYIETEESIELNKVDIPCTFEQLDTGKAIITEFIAITPIMADDGIERSQILIYDDLIYYSPSTVAEIYKMIKDDNTLWQRKN
jgi:hypothetical protein